jgi:hypothetical protein
LILVIYLVRNLLYLTVGLVLARINAPISKYNCTALSVNAAPINFAKFF